MIQGHDYKQQFEGKDPCSRVVVHGELEAIQEIQ